MTVMRRCEVLVDKVPAGILTETDNPTGYNFEYYEEYVTNGRMPVCIAMPVRKEAFQSEVLFPYFFNILSEGDNRAIQSSYLRIDKDDDFGILMETARYDTPGNVTVRPI